MKNKFNLNIDIAKCTKKLFGLVMNVSKKINKIVIELVNVFAIQISHFDLVID